MTRSKTRTVQQKLWLTPEEKQSWEAKANESGLNLSDFIRRCVERRKLSSPPPQVNLDTARELGKIGLNLNQQIRAMNTALASGQNIPNIEESLAVVEKVYETVKQVQLQLLLGDDTE